MWLGQGPLKKVMKFLHKKFGYMITKPLCLYRPFSRFDDTAMGTMPLAIRCFYESEDWESCIPQCVQRQV